MLQLQIQQMQHVEHLEKDVWQMEQDVLSQQSLVHYIKELKQPVMHSLEIVYLAQILQLLLLPMLVRIEIVLWILLLRVIQNVRVGYRLAFGKEQQDVLSHRLVHHLQEQLTHALPSQQQMDLAMEQEVLQHQLLVPPTILFAQLPLQPTILMHNAKLGDLFVVQMDLDVFWLQLLLAQV